MWWKEDSTTSSSSSFWSWQGFVKFTPPPTIAEIESEERDLFVEENITNLATAARREEEIRNPIRIDHDYKYHTLFFLSLRLNVCVCVWRRLTILKWQYNVVACLFACESLLARLFLDASISKGLDRNAAPRATIENDPMHLDHGSWQLIEERRRRSRRRRPFLSFCLTFPTCLLSTTDHRTWIWREDRTLCCYYDDVKPPPHPKDILLR